MSAVSDLLTRKKPTERSITISLDPDKAETLSTARRVRDTAQLSADEHPENAQLADRAMEAAQKYEEAVAAMRGSVVRMTFRAIDRQELDRLKGEHRPTERQKTDARKRKEPEPEWNNDTFPPVLIAAACVRIEGPSGGEDGISVEDAEKFWASPDYNMNERAAVFHTAVAAQMALHAVGDLPKDD